MKGARFYSQVMVLFDRLSSLPASSVTAETKTLTHRTAKANETKSPAGVRSDSHECVAEDAMLWTEVAKLLVRSGSWRTALAVLDGLPPSVRMGTVQAAVHERWPLPSDVLLTLQVTTSSAASTDALEGRNEDSISSARLHTAAATRQPSHEQQLHFPSVTTTTAPTPSHQSASSANASATSDSVAFLGLTADDLLSRAFECRQPRNSAAAEALARTQEAIVNELRRRGMYRELLQCVVNWRSRGLVVDRFYASTSSSGTVPGSAEPAKADAQSPYDAIAAVRELLFPPPAAFPAKSTEQAPPPWRVALETCPLLFARCVRDGAACEHFLRNGSATRSDVYDTIAALLRCLEEAAQGVMAAPGGDLARVTQDVEVLWRAAGVLTRAVQPWLRQEPKVVKETLLRRTAAALKATARMRRGLSAAPLPPPPQRESTAAPHGELPPKAVTALRATVESLCSVLPQHEAQVRFIRLTVFSEIAQCLEALGVGLTNGLVQCLFLCLGGEDVVTSEETLCDAGRPSLRAAVNTPLARFLAAEPMARYAPALELVQEAQSRRWFRVSATHLHSLLSGLQSISIVKTWQQALACVDFFDRQLHILPDDSSMPILVLNLSQDTWQRAFDVLRYYRQEEADCTSAHRRTRRPPAAVMRDLHLISVKHGAWETTLRMMQELLQLNQRCLDEQTHGRRSQLSVSAAAYVGFMNYLYSLYAAGMGGRADLCVDLFAALAHAPGRRSGVSPYNDVTVAVAAVALLDRCHYSEAVRFADAVLSGAFLSSKDRRTKGVRAGQPALQMPSAAEEACLTPAGRDMAQALKLVGMLHGWQGYKAEDKASATTVDVSAADIVSLLSDLDAAAATDADEPPLRRVLHCAVTLSSMCGMGHLHAPLRLVFDTVAGPGAYEGSTAGERTFETRQVSAAGAGGGSSTRSSRRTLFIPPSHRVAQSTFLARALGLLVKHVENASVVDGGSTAAPTLSAEVVRGLAEGMASAGVGPEFLKASLL